MKQRQVATLECVVTQLRSYLAARGHRHPQIRQIQRGRCAEKILRPYTDHRAWISIDLECLADDRRIASQIVLPEARAHYGFGSKTRFLFFAAKQTAQSRLHPES